MPNAPASAVIRQPNWSSLGSLNSFGESNTTPASSQEHSTTGVNARQPPARETLHSRFEFKQTLGKGTYGKVKLALDKRKNELVAIKTIKKSRIENPHDLARIRREIDFMTSLNHPYIIKIKEGLISLVFKIDFNHFLFRFQFMKVERKLFLLWIMPVEENCMIISIE